MNKIIFSIFFMLSSLIVIAQNDGNDFKKQSYLSVGGSFTNEQILDRTFSPLKFSGNIPRLHVGFERISSSTKRWFIELNVSQFNADVVKQNIFDGEDYFKSTLVNFNLTGGLTKTIVDKDKYQLQVGGQFSSRTLALSYNDFDSGSWMTSQNLEVLAKAILPLEDNQELVIAFSYPLLSLYSRPTYGGVDDFVINYSDDILKIFYSRMKLKSGLGYVNPMLSAKYRIGFGKINLYAKVKAEYLSLNSVTKLNWNSVGAELGFAFKL